MKKNARLHWKLSPVTDRLKQAQSLETEPLSQNTRKRRRTALAHTLGLSISEDEKKDPTALIEAELMDLENSMVLTSDVVKKSDPFDSLLDEIEDDFPFSSSSSQFPFPSSDLKDIEDWFELPAQSWYRFQVIGRDGDAFSCQTAEGIKAKLRLQDPWAQLSLETGDFVHVVRPQKQGNDLLVNATQGLLIVHPDTLISCTTVADALGCMRRACLSLLVPQDIKPGGNSASLIVGSIVHDLYERSLRQGQVSAADLDGWLTPMLARSLPHLLGTAHDEKWLEGEVRRLCINLPSWIDLHLRSQPHPQARVLEEGRGVVTPIAIGKVEACEENIWCHCYGLKGKIDATVRTEAQLAPLELKTGHVTTAVAHRAQTLLYTLMLSDRYGEEVSAGLLHYLSTGQFIRLTVKREIINDLIMTRNRLATSIHQARQSLTLPPPIQNDHVCGKCFQQFTCLTYRRLAEGLQDAPLPSQPHPQPDPFSSEWFKKWERLVTLEEAEAFQARQQMWRQPISERVKKGITLLDLLMISQEEEGEKEVEEGEDDEGFRVKALLKWPGGGNCSLAEGDAIVLSAQQMYGLAIGFVEECLGSTIRLRLDRPIRVWQGLRLDRDELVTGFGLLRANLIRMFTPEAEFLHQIVIGGAEPVYGASQKVKTSSLDACQQQVIEAIVGKSPSFAVILGMPGTGKTTCLVQMLLQLMQANQRILLTSHTHAAVDNVMARLLEAGGDAQRMARIGNPSRIVEPTVKALAWQGKRWPGGLQEMRRALSQQLVVGVTCMGINQ